MLKRPAMLFAGLLLAAVLVFGMIRLFALRFERGDVYPAYSTLRSDPLGASVLYESLSRLPGTDTRRVLERVFPERSGKGAALFILGAAPWDFSGMSREEFGHLQRFVLNGGNVTIAFLPEMTRPWQARNRTNMIDGHVETNQPVEPHVKKKKEKKSEPKKVAQTNHVDKAGPPAKPGHDDDDDDLDEPGQRHQYTDLNKEWGFEIAYDDLTTNEDHSFEFPLAERTQKRSDLPSPITIHTAVCFTNLAKGWAVVYQRSSNAPVVAERAMGRGTVRLIADAYPLSNEALFRGPDTVLLSWLAGPAREFLFDEAHLGVTEDPGMAALMRRYQLEGMILALGAAAALFVWKNASSLVPRDEEADLDGAPLVAGRDSASGLVNLTRRSLPPAGLIEACYGEWKKTTGRAAALSNEQRREIEHLVQEESARPPRQRRPVAAYRAISEIVQRRK